MVAEPIPEEVEVKLEATAHDVLQEIAAIGTLGAYRLRRRRLQSLETTYFDTPGLTLAHAGVAVRVRRAGRRWEATAKWPGRVDGALHTRPELTVPLPRPPAGAFVPAAGPLAEALQPYLLGRPLQPVLVTTIERRPLDVLPADGTRTALAEVALDAVQLQRPDGSPAAPEYWEVEIEQRGGAPDDCLAVARLLRRRFHLVPSRSTKFERGLAAVLPPGELVAPLAPVAVTDSLDTAMRKIIAVQLGRLRAVQPTVRRGDQAEAVHEMRVAVRRLRTAQRLGKAALPVRQREALARELRWLAQALGQVRDLDVQLANAAWHRQRLAPAARGPVDGLRRALRRQRLAAMAALAQVLDSARYTRLLLSLERAAATPRRPARGAAAEPVARAGRRAIKRAIRRMYVLGDAIGELPTAEELHALRISAKRLRYLLEALKPISGRDGRRVTKQLVRLQDVLGRFNDAMVAAATVRRHRHDLGASAPPPTREALTAIADAELRRAGAAQAQFDRAWQRFRARASRRRLRSLRDALAAASPPPPPAPGAP
jgi:inorganic triphosphatase YgiF